MRISDWSSDVCSSDWFDFSWYVAKGVTLNLALLRNALIQAGPWAGDNHIAVDMPWLNEALGSTIAKIDWKAAADDVRRFLRRSEEQTSELTSLMRIQYAVFCMKTTNNKQHI